MSFWRDVSCSFTFAKVRCDEFITFLDRFGSGHLVSSFQVGVLSCASIAMLFTVFTHVIVEFALCIGQVLVYVVFVFTHIPPDEESNKVEFFLFLIFFIRLNSLTATSCAGLEPETLADPKKEGAAIYFLVSITCDGFAAAFTDALVAANSNFQDDTLLFFVVGMLTSLSLFNIGLLKLNGFLNSDGSVQEQPTE